MRLAACLKHDVTLQLRHGFYHAYIVVCAAYIVGLRFLPATPREWALPVIIYSDPGMLGFYFIGGMVLLERGESTLNNLFVTPLRVREYLASKVASLTLLAVVTGVVIALLGRLALDFRIGLLILGVTLTSVFYVLIGIVAVARMQRLNEYIMYSIVYMLLLNVPLLDHFGLWKHPVFWVTPTKASLVLIGGSFSKAAPPVGELVLAVTVLVVWIAGVYLWARRWFEVYVVEHAGDAP